MSFDRDQFVAFDPGVKYFAWAVFRGGALDAAGLSNKSPRDWVWPGISFAIVECPESQFSQETRERDIYALARAAGEIGIQFPERLYVAPSRWKGQIPKEIHHPRIVSQLDEFERKTLPTKKTELKHVLDAVGIGLWYLGRGK